MAEELRLFDADITAQLPLHEDGDSTAAQEALFRVSEAAREVVEASGRFSRAVVKGRRVGCSWRRLGEASGVPYQSLHRNFAKQERSGRRLGVRTSQSR
jgi:hypothetical protein